MLANNLLSLHLAALHKQFASIALSIRILYGEQFCYFYIYEHPLIKSFGILKIHFTNGKTCISDHRYKSIIFTCNNIMFRSLE